MADGALGRVDPVASDPSMHVRMLVTIPLLIAAEDLLEIRCADTIEHVRDERMVERANLDAILTSVEHLRGTAMRRAHAVRAAVARRGADQRGRDPFRKDAVRCGAVT